MKRASGAVVATSVVVVGMVGAGAVGTAGMGAVAGATSPADSEVVTIGAILSESGIYSTLGPPEHNAIVMGLEALNATGFDVGGTHYTMDVTFADDESDAATTGVAAFREMAEVDEVPVIGFGLGSALYAPLLERTPLP